MNQTTRLPTRRTDLSNQLRRMVNVSKAIRPATSAGMYTTQTIDGVHLRPKARIVSEQPIKGSGAYYA